MFQWFYDLFMMYIMPLFVQFFDLFGVKLTGNTTEGNEVNEVKEKRVQFEESDMPPLAHVAPFPSSE
jgi:hypothetical protein